MKPLISGLAFCAALTGAQGHFTGVITDSECSDGDHSHMKMGPTDGECVVACVASHGALYVLYDGKQSWTLSDQKTPEKFAGKRVSITGTLDATSKTIQVTSIVPAK
jgi:hypothetical protein